MDEAGRVEQKLDALAERLEAQLTRMQRTVEAVETNTLGIEAIERRLRLALGLLVLILLLAAAGLGLELWRLWR